MAAKDAGVLRKFRLSGLARMVGVFDSQDTLEGITSIPPRAVHKPGRAARRYCSSGRFSASSRTGGT